MRICRGLFTVTEGASLFFLKMKSQVNRDFRDMLTRGQESFDDVKGTHSEVEEENEKLISYMSDMKMSQDAKSMLVSGISVVISNE